MLIIPITTKISWRNPPYVTLAIILINCIVYFGFQLNDDENRFRAEEYYYVSGLAAIEVPKYLEYLKNQGEDTAQYNLKGDAGRDTYFELHQKMDENYWFMKQLENGFVISDDNPRYEEWKNLRSGYNEKLSKVVYLTYGFIPAHARPVTFFTHMFLHGNAGHLIGNMVFLWLVGCMLELGCGRIFFAVSYIITGIGAVTLFWLVYMHSTMPLVGASGAIAGIMGAFTMMYGFRKIKVFYSLGFYFNYVKFPAIFLFPVWVGNEFFQLFSDTGSHIAYMAHVGGLLSGGSAGFIKTKFLGNINEDVIREEPVDEISPLIEKALKCIGELDFDGGRAYLEQALEKDPASHIALSHLLNIDKHDPENTRFHETAKRLLFTLCSDKHTHDMVHGVYKDYTRLAKPRFSPEIYIRLCAIFASTDHMIDAENILKILLKKKPDTPGIPTALLKLSDAFRKKGMDDKFEKYRKILSSHYAHSAEAQMARRS